MRGSVRRKAVALISTYGPGGASGRPSGAAGVPPKLSPLGDRQKSHCGAVIQIIGCDVAITSELTTEKGETITASGKTDEAKGRLKEAAGALTGNKKLKREGKVDQATGKVKQTAEKILDKAKDAIN